MSLIKVLPYQEGLEQMARLAIRRSLIPVFGAGFTAGCPSACGVVPDANDALSSMRDMVCESSTCPFTYQDLSEMNFFEISDLFFEYTSAEKRAEYFEKCYTDVHLYPHQIKFLMDINWPYAYTINVDDGIEKNSDFNVILPYHKFRRPKTSKKLLYKLHGDASYESKYLDDQNNIVFSQKQYMQAITDESNTDIYDSLLSDYSQQNLVFIGCSLQAEQDLQFIYEKSKAFKSDTYRIVLRKSEPSLKEQQKLRQHGINEIVLIEDYERFYEDLLQVYSEQLSVSRESLYSYFNPAIISYTDKKTSLSLLSGNDVFDYQNNRFMKGAFHVLRSPVDAIVKDLEKNSYVLLKGRRFSGKTYCLCSIAEYYKTKDIYFFPSTSYVDEDVIQKIFDTVQNSLFLFDSNSISPSVYGLIVDYSSSLKENNNLMVIAANTNDNYLLSKLSCNVIDLFNTFDDKELKLIKKALDSFGLICRRKKQTNIDFLFILKEKQNIEIALPLETRPQFTQNEKAVLVALCALDKLYNSDLVALSFAQRELDLFCKKLSPIVEIVSVGKDEVTRHSSKKLVHNSKIALIQLLNDFDSQDITLSIRKLVRCFKKDYSRKRLYIEIILFDTINQIFADHPDSKSLIYNIYTDLQPLLKDDLHYWLQRAKSIYRTTNDATLLDEAYTYAQKAYADGNDSISIKAALTISLILCAIAEQETSPKSLHIYESAVVYAYEAVFSEYFRVYPTYLNSELAIGKNTRSERRITKACEVVRACSENEDYTIKSMQILDQFQKLKSKKQSQEK